MKELSAQLDTRLSAVSLEQYQAVERQLQEKVNALESLTGLRVPCLHS